MSRRTFGPASRPALSEAALARYPGVVAIVDAAGGITVLAENSEPANGFLREDARRRQLVDAARQAAATGSAARQLLPAPTPGGFVDTTILPLGDELGAIALIHDLDFETTLRARLIESRERYRDLLTLTGYLIWETDAEGCFAFVSPGGMLGWTPDELLIRPAASLIVADGGAGDGPDLADAGVFATREPVRDAELWLRRADGESDCVAVSALPLHGRDGTWKGARGFCRLVTEERRRDRDRAQGQLRDRLTVHLARIIRDTIDPRDVLRSTASLIDFAVGAAGGAMLRWSPGGEWHEAWQWGAAMGDGEPLASWARRAARAEVPWFPGERPVLALETRFGGGLNGALIIWRGEGDPDFTPEDHLVVTEAAAQLGSVMAQVAQHEAAAALARTDPLTGLLNRRALLEEATRRLKRLQWHSRPIAVAFIDLDNFKQVNDRLGHQAGDEALLAACRLLREHSRSEDLVARIGGDEFVLWLDGVDAGTAEGRARQLLEAARALAPLSNNPDRPLGLSVGIAIHDAACPETVEALLARADRALYAAKRDGKGRFALADPAKSAVMA